MIVQRFSSLKHEVQIKFLDTIILIILIIYTEITIKY